MPAAAKKAPAKRAPRVRARAYCLTVNNYTEEERKQLLDYPCQYVIVGKEKGEEGTLHLQAYIYFENQMDFASVKKISPRAHIEKAKGTGAQNYDYCSKEGDFEERGTKPGQGDRTDLKAACKEYQGGKRKAEMLEEFGGTWVRYSQHIKRTCREISNEGSRNVLRDDMANKEKRPWQEQAILDIDAQDDRKILFIVDEAGDKGKSWLSTWLHVTRGAMVVNTTKADTVFYLYENENIVVFDLPRSSIDYLNYGTLEAFKNAFFTSSKYEVVVKYTDKVKVVVMMNQEPDMTKLSEDRYQIMTL